MIGAHVSTAGGLTQAPLRAHALGVATFQIHTQSPQMWAARPIHQESVDLFTKALSKSGFTTYFFHAIYLLNLATDNPDHLTKSINWLVAQMFLARDLHSSGVILHLGSGAKSLLHDPLATIITSLQTVLAETSDCPDVVLENTVSGGSKIGSLTDLAAILTAVNSPRLKVCLDTCHLFADGFALDAKDGLKTITEITRCLPTGTIVALHVNDAKFPLGSNKDRHENLGEGAIGLPALKWFLNCPEFLNLPKILETPGFTGNGPDLRNVALLKSITS